MGRTNRTYRQHLEQFLNKVGRFRDELRGSNKEHFDSLEEKAFKHAHAGGALNSTKPALPAFLSMLLGLQKQLNEVEERLEEIENGIQS